MVPKLALSTFAMILHSQILLFEAFSVLCLCVTSPLLFVFLDIICWSGDYLAF